MRVLVCGGRDFADRDSLESYLTRFHEIRRITMLIHGGAGYRDEDGRIVAGADILAGEWAEFNGIPTMMFPANWTAFGRSAGPIRNEQMLKEGRPDLVVAFPGGNGTTHMVKIARRAGLEAIEVRP